MIFFGIVLLILAGVVFKVTDGPSESYGIWMPLGFLGTILVIAGLQ